MKKILIIAAAFLVVFTACKKADFEDAYPDPSKISTSTIEKQFSGFITSNREYVLPAYWNYFVVLRTTLTRYTQAVGWVNASNQYVPGAAGIDAYWGTYYTLLAQYREFEKIYAAAPTEDQDAKRIYMITASIYLYDHTQKMVDLHGDIPFSEAGMLSTNGGDYENSLPKYDKAEDLYTKMLDDLKGFADELNSISVTSAIQAGFKTQDVVNKGNLAKWKMYCNSLRLRMLNRVSGVASFQARVAAETAAILANSSSYPVITDNADNVQFDVINQNSPINSQGFQTGLEDWDGNLAGKAMIDHMNTNADPRLRIMFEEGEKADSAVFLGLDPLLIPDAQTTLYNTGTLSIYNRSTLSRNDYFPGELMNSAEVHFLIAEIHLRAGNDGAAKLAYNAGIAQSVANYYQISLSNDNTSGDVAPYTAAEVEAYLDMPAVKWDNATSTDAKLGLIATQKWIHYSVVQPYESWSELRRLNAPSLNFQVDNANDQSLPPYRWYYGSSEPIYNTVNYGTVRSKDNLTTKIFWDVN